MPHQTPAYCPPSTFLALLTILLAATGCGLTSQGAVTADADRAVDAALHQVNTDLAADASHDNQTVASAADLKSPSDRNITRRGRWRLPDELALDLPTIPFGPVVPVSSRAELLATKTQSDNMPRNAQVGAPPGSPTSANLSGLATASRLQTASERVGSKREPQSTQKVDKIGGADFEQLVLGSDVPVVVDFYADWCGPCKSLSPLLDELARQRSDLRFVKVNIDHDKALRRKYGVRSVPTVMIFHEGNLVAQHTGVPDIKKALAE